MYMGFRSATRQNGKRKDGGRRLPPLFMKKYFIAGLFYILPLIFGGRLSLSYSPKLFSQIAIILISLSLIVLIKDYIPLSIRLFYLWCIVTTFTSRIPQFSAIALMVVTLVVLLYRMMLKMDFQDLEFNYKIIAIAMCTQVFWIFAQVMNRDFIMNLPREVNFVFGAVGNKNILGALFLFSVVPMYKFKKWTAILPILGVVYSKASASIFALGGGILFYILFSKLKNKAFLIILVISILGILWMNVDNPVKGFMCGRLPVWKKIIHLMFERKTVKSDVWDIRLIEKIRNPWLGYGLGTFKFEFPGRLTVKEAGGPIIWRRAHNLYLQIGRECGLIGMFLVIMIPSVLFYYFFRYRQDNMLIWMAGIVMICLNAIGNFPDRHFALMFYLMFPFVMARKLWDG